MNLAVITEKNIPRFEKIHEILIWFDTMYINENQMYRDVKDWLERIMHRRYKKIPIIVEDTSRVKLSDFIQKKGISDYFPTEYITYDIKVDVTGVILKKVAELILVECKLKEITLRDLSQLIGYTVITNPKYSILLSPSGISNNLLRLLNVYNRRDILKYGRNKSIIIARWDINKKDIDYNSVIPSGFIFRF